MIPPCLMRAFALIIAMACMSGCAGYWPLRLPQRDLWAAAPVEPEPLRVPGHPAKSYSHQLHQGGLSVALELLDSTHAQQAFHLDLARHGIQPVMLAIQNHTEQTYAFHKADFGRGRVIPASRVAGLGCPHPVRIAGGYMKWLAFLVPGFLFETVIEPSTTFDFPIMREASRHPSWPSCGARRRMFTSQEFADGDILPGASRTGVVFLRPIALESTLTVIVRHAQTGEPLALVLPTPASTTSKIRLDSKPPAVVWPVVLESARRISSWRVKSADPKTGVIMIGKRSELAPWARSRPVTVQVRLVGDGRTQTTVERPLREPLSTSLEPSNPAVEHFFRELSEELPPPPPPPRPAPSLSRQGGPKEPADD